MGSSNSSGNVSLKSFPDDKRDALAIIYLQNQDLSDKTPEEIADMYNDAWDRIAQQFKVIREREAEKRRESPEYRPLY